MESLFSPGFIQLDERPLQDTRSLVRSYLQLKKNWSDVLEKIVAAVNLWLRGNLSLKGVVSYVSHTPTPPPLLSFSSTSPTAYLGNLVGALLRLL